MRHGYISGPWIRAAGVALCVIAMCGPTFGAPENTPPPTTPSPKDDIIDKYLRDCHGKPVKDAACDKLKDQAVAILQEDLHLLGSTASRSFMPDILNMFVSDEPDLRIAAADALGMIGPQDQDLEAIIPLTNDPVPDVRYAVFHMISRGKGKALDLLKERLAHQNPGRNPEKPAEPAQFSMPLAPDSVYRFDSSDPTKGRLSYVVRGKGDTGSFFKAKAKKGPYSWDQFKEQYRYQLKDEGQAMDQMQQAAGKQLENEKPPDPATNMQAYLEYIQRIGSVSMQGSMGRMYFDNYQPNLYASPSVYILEERQIGQRSYPTKYVVVYQELAFKRPGYRLAWMTAPDSAIKAAQATSLAEEQQELANKAESEALKKKAADLETLMKKKDAVEKKQFKKGQDDLEKALGF
ncbi:MAG TPA: HEAT repeat domain-containing protein [Nitrospira sp.]|nr:HEAT repeat domain-containing protein [Nitrospira sp.]